MSILSGRTMPTLSKLTGLLDLYHKHSSLDIPTEPKAIPAKVNLIYGNSSFHISHSNKSHTFSLIYSLKFFQ